MNNGNNGVRITLDASGRRPLAMLREVQARTAKLAPITD
jgi:hypothetical protein